MEMDQQRSFIFGSFSRRSNDTQKNVKKSLIPLADNLQYKDLSPSKSQTLNVNWNVDAKTLKCFICQQYFNEPKLLPCLHTFCLKCLEKLETKLIENDDNDEESVSINKLIKCPVCETCSEIPENGVVALPFNHTIQHKIVLAALNDSTTKLLCDLCPDEIVALARCIKCAINLCDLCSKKHLALSKEDHEVLDLREARRKGITRIRRQIMCSCHSSEKLTTFCSTCSQVICNICSLTSHKNHNLKQIQKAAKLYTKNIQSSIEQTKLVFQTLSDSMQQLDNSTKTIEEQCNKMYSEIEGFIENYKKSIEEHYELLISQLDEIKSMKLKMLQCKRSNIERNVKNSLECIRFANELLQEGSEIELLQCVTLVTKRLETFHESNKIGNEMKVSTSFQFLPEEIATNLSTPCPLYGIITTQILSIKNCTLNVEGLGNLRVGRKAAAILETKDSSGKLLQRGGEKVNAFLKYLNGINKVVELNVEDSRDGVYKIYVIPNTPGKIQLSILIQNQHIKESPLLLLVRTLRPHRGIFHCCTFCSSGGNKEATCGCGAKMPGDYKGCGHGHDGHPGKTHWSCCGNTLEHSECVRSASLTNYQITI